MGMPSSVVKPTVLSTLPRPYALAKRLADWVDPARVHRPRGVFGAEHLGPVLQSYARYYDTWRTHRALDKDASVHPVTERFGAIVSRSRYDHAGP